MKTSVKTLNSANATKNSTNLKKKQECIPVGCVPPACRPAGVPSRHPLQETPLSWHPLNGPPQPWMTHSLGWNSLHRTLLSMNRMNHKQV